MKKLIYILVFFTLTSFAQDTKLRFKRHGAKKSIAYKNIKNPKSEKLNDFNSADALSSAIKYIQDRDGHGTIYVTKAYTINPDSTIVIPNGINLVMKNRGSFHTDFDGTLLRFDSHYSGNHRLNLYYKMHDRKNASWWKLRDEDTIRNKQSVAVEFLNSRRNEINIEAWGFTKGLFLVGNKNGTVENSVTLRDLRNNRYGIYLDGENGGWVTQNNFKGGRINLVKTGRDPLERLECAGIYSTGGDNNSFQDINMEGGSDYQYIIYDKGVLNQYINLRFEQSMFAGSINFETWYGGNTIVGGYGYTPFKTGRLSKFYDPEQKIIKRGYVHVHRSSSFYQGSGNMYLGGSQIPDQTPTLILKNEHNDGTILELQKLTDHSKVIFQTDGKIMFHTGKDDYVDLKKRMLEYGDVNEQIYTKDSIYGRGDWFGDYYATKIFKASTFENDLKLHNISKNPRSLPPIIFKDGYIYTKGIRDIKDYKQ